MLDDLRGCLLDEASAVVVVVVAGRDIDGVFDEGEVIGGVFRAILVVVVIPPTFGVLHEDENLVFLWMADPGEL